MEKLDTPKQTKVVEAPHPKPSLTQVVHTIFSKDPESDERKAIAGRRRFVMAAVLGTLGVNFLMFLRFFFPRVLYEPNTKFKIGYPSDFGFGVDTKFQSQHRIWVVRNTEGIFVIWAVCTHLGCTPTGSPARTNSSAPATAAGTTPKESTSKARRPGPWTGPTSNSILKARSSWM